MHESVLAVGCEELAVILVEEVVRHDQDAEGEEIVEEHD